MNGDDRFRRAMARFDEANAQDPNRTAIDGRDEPDELLYARRMTERLGRLEPGASEALRLAVRCQHICRWRIPRADYPPTRAGYLKWRATLGGFHADLSGEILRDTGYSDEIVRRVQALVRKESLKSDAETQTLEDVACLVFLEHYFADFAARHDEPKLLNILSRTWKKMSDRGRAAALELSLASAERALLTKALSREPVPGPPSPVAPAAPEAP